MEHLRQVEADLQSLGLEAKKKYPEVKEATEKALLALKAMRDVYIQEMMKDKSKSVSLKSSSEVMAPYILILNYSDAALKPYIQMGLNGIHQMLQYNIASF